MPKRRAFFGSASTPVVVCSGGSSRVELSRAVDELGASYPTASDKLAGEVAVAWGYSPINRARADKSC